MDVVLLSRLQFAMTIMFHYLFPPLTIGLGLILVFLELQWLRTGESIYHQATRFWTKMFGINFALGVATGIVMEFQFGTNWAVYSRYVGDVFGSALAAEGIFAFFLESGFLAVLLYGWDKVTPAFHFFSTCMVALGSVFSSVWIVVANSWQQTPAGFHVVEREINEHVFRRAEIVDFWQLVFNPSTMHRLVHVWFGAFILGAFFVLSISAWYLLKDRHREFAVRSFSGALLLGTLAALAQLVSGHFNADMVAVVNFAAVISIPYAMRRHWSGRAFLASGLAVCALVLLLGLALFPNLVTSAPVPENSLTIYNAASSPKTLGIMLIMAVIGMPFVIAYTSIIYWVFRHRVSTGGSYG